MPRVTSTIDIWTSFSKANVSFVVGVPTAHGELSTMTPVYALGSPVQSTSLVTYPDIYYTYTTVTGVTPDCKFTRVSTVVSQADCGQCTMNGGTVKLLYWEDQATNPISVTSITSDWPQTVVSNGTTLYSPSVYISFQTAFATNSCGRVGLNYTGTMLTLHPEDLSTQVHVGGKVYQTGANRYESLNYADLGGLPPVDVYESQPSCIMFGCPTIYSTSYFPTIAIPPKMRSMDAAWIDCDVGLDGLYDPPIALTPQVVMATPTEPSVVFPLVTPASPSSTPATYGPSTIAYLSSSTSVSGPLIVQSPVDHTASDSHATSLASLSPSELAASHPFSTSVGDPQSWTSDSSTTIPEASDLPQDPEATDSYVSSKSPQVDPTQTSTVLSESEGTETGIDAWQRTSLNGVDRSSSVNSLNALSVMLSALDDPSMQLNTQLATNGADGGSAIHSSLVSSCVLPASGLSLSSLPTTINSETPTGEQHGATLQGTGRPDYTLSAGSSITTAASSSGPIRTAASHDTSRADEPSTVRQPALATAALSSPDASRASSAIATVALPTISPCNDASSRNLRGAARALTVLWCLLSLIIVRM
ncbi:hypothetical protein LTR10_008002 [Elasticomyces elasticus]|nr:hypothetical protein LTR10_008002 [Elasticomyces elasticus]KAK4970999.1 hypothetical protein LTR42_007978 [Elasticomyces elasticus]